MNSLFFTGTMVVSKMPTRSHGVGGDGKHPPRKPSNDNNIHAQTNKEKLTKLRYESTQVRTSEVDTEATILEY